jgi:adenylate cyclase class 2
MIYEVEQKFPVADLVETEARLADLNAVVAPPMRELDRYFAHPARDFAETDEALRIRSVGDVNCVTYKGPRIDSTTKTRHEIELPLAPTAAAAENFATLLNALGFRPVAEVHKTRHTVTVPWHGRKVTGALDRVDGLGHFVELELCVASAEIEKARRAIRSLAKRLGLSRTERRRYLELLLEQRRGPG